MLRAGVGHPERCVFLKKKGTASTNGFWGCEYDGEFKTCSTPVNWPKPTIPKSSPHARKATQTQHPATRNTPTADTAPGPPRGEAHGDPSETEEFSEDDKPCDLEFWFRDEDDCVFRSKRTDPSAENVERPRLHAGEISTLYGMVSDVVDESKYYMAVNSLTSALTVTWKQSERGLHCGKFVASKRIIDAARGEKFHASCSSSLSVHSYSECVVRAERWCVCVALCLDL